MAAEVRHCLARASIVKGDYAGIASGGEEGATWREANCADGRGLSGEGVGEAGGGGVENVDVAGWVGGCC